MPPLNRNYRWFIIFTGTNGSDKRPETVQKRNDGTTLFAKHTVSLIMAPPMLAGAALPTVTLAHPGPEAHPAIIETPIAGKDNNYWYDYRSDLEEAEIELRKDLRRAKTAQDEREARSEYRRELADARKDYTKEMRELGYIGRGEVEVLDR